MPLTDSTTPSRCTVRRPGSSPDIADALSGIGIGPGDRRGSTTRRSRLYAGRCGSHPDDAVIHCHLSAALKAKGRLDEALTEAREAVRLSPDDPDLLRNLGDALSTRSLRRGRGRLSGSARESPRPRLALNSLAWLLVTAPEHAKYDPSEAVALARKAVELGSQIPTNVNTLGVALYRAGLLDEAITTLRRSALLNRGKDASDWFFLAMACWRRGELGEASNYFVRGVSTFRNFRQEGPDYDLLGRGVRASSAPSAPGRTLPGQDRPRSRHDRAPPGRRRRQRGPEGRLRGIPACAPAGSGPIFGP